MDSVVHVAHVSSSRKRRMRAIATRKKLWCLQHAQSPDVATSNHDCILQGLFEIRFALMNSVVYTPIYVPFHTNVDACEGVASIGKTYCANDYSEFQVGATAHENGLATKHTSEQRKWSTGL